jgi:hypothetical protein
MRFRRTVAAFAVTLLTSTGLSVVTDVATAPPAEAAVVKKRLANSSGRRNTVNPFGLETIAMVSLPELDVARVERWCRARVPEQVRDRVRVEVDVADRHLTIVECRPLWRADLGTEWTRFPIARLRYTKGTRLWSLYWRDRNLRFHSYDRVPATTSVEDLLAEVDRDPTAIFWG